jgi:2-hydroxychromene-2-carboxylate isomerase
MDIEFFYEFASTYSYPSAMTVEARAAERGLSVRFRPFLLGPIFAAQGMNDSPFNLFPEKGRYMWRDLERVCAELGLPFRRPSVFPRRSVLAARVALLGVEEGFGPAFTRAIYQANFVADRDIDSTEVIHHVLTELALDADDVLKRATTEGHKTRLREQTERARSLGIFGAPSFVVNGELFWGQDRMQQAFDWAARAH